MSSVVLNWDGLQIWKVMTTSTKLTIVQGTPLINTLAAQARRAVLNGKPMALRLLEKWIKKAQKQLENEKAALEKEKEKLEKEKEKLEKQKSKKKTSGRKKKSEIEKLASSAGRTAVNTLIRKLLK